MSKISKLLIFVSFVGGIGSLILKGCIESMYHDIND